MFLKKLFSKFEHKTENNMELNESNSIDGLEKDIRETSVTDTLLESKFAPPTQAVDRMAKAREARRKKMEERKTALVASNSPSEMTTKEERDLYSSAILTFIQVKNPRSAVEFDAVKLLASDVVSHVKEMYP